MKLKIKLKLNAHYANLAWFVLDSIIILYEYRKNMIKFIVFI